MIAENEFRTRCDNLRSHLDNLSGVVLFDADYIKYYTGFAFIPTERPMAFVMNAAGERALFVPRLELEHAQANALIDRVAHYIEYPDISHPSTVLADLLKEMGVTGDVAADSDGYPWIFGYRGPSLTESAGVTVHPIRAVIEDQLTGFEPAASHAILMAVVRRVSCGL
jgi:Xaa-Pro dipeptidase